MFYQLVWEPQCDKWQSSDNLHTTWTPPTKGHWGSQSPACAWGTNSAKTPNYLSSWKPLRLAFSFTVFWTGWASQILPVQLPDSAGSVALLPNSILSGGADLWNFPERRNKCIWIAQSWSESSWICGLVRFEMNVVYSLLTMSRFPGSQ